MSLEDYKRKRNFSRTSEPKAEDSSAGTSQKGRKVYVIQKHLARSLHYDLRLEADGVLKSWAIPRGPSLDPVKKRLAVEVEDHPIDYADFEGVIPEGEYGAGKVIIWDKGTYVTGSKGKSFGEMFEGGSIKIEIHGKKLRGKFTLVKTKWAGKKNNWLLIKENDSHADRESDVLVESPLSVVSSLDVNDIT